MAVGVVVPSSDGLGEHDDFVGGDRVLIEKRHHAGCSYR